MQFIPSLSNFALAFVKSVMLEAASLLPSLGLLAYPQLYWLIAAFELTSFCLVIMFLRLFPVVLRISMARVWLSECLV